SSDFVRAFLYLPLTGTYSVRDRSTESASPPVRCRCHFQHEIAKAEIPKPLWTSNSGLFEVSLVGFSCWRGFQGAGSLLRGKLGMVQWRVPMKNGFCQYLLPAFRQDFRVFSKNT